MTKQRCAWLNYGKAPSELYIQYHDEEWGVAIHDDRLLFEFLILEGAQAGLSWITILNKRDNYRKAYDNFDPIKISKYSDEKQLELLRNTGIVRNKLKINASIINAKAFLEVQNEFGSFNKYIWSFTDHKIIHNQWKSLKDIPVTTKESDVISKDLKKRGFKFVGSTICYAFMQAVGMVNDHSVDCFRCAEIG
ncbi:DNA-3-methyladenine glycosylase I [Rickettsiaceae bacterium]|nr:DNA-3-methyladenine glycosylase I [Rickettsiaceae bacterium]